MIRLQAKYYHWFLVTTVIRIIMVFFHCLVNFVACAFLFSPPGVFEFENFQKGTKAMMDAVVHATEKGATSIIGIFFICLIHTG